LRELYLRKHPIQLRSVLFFLREFFSTASAAIRRRRLAYDARSKSRQRLEGIRERERKKERQKERKRGKKRNEAREREEEK